MLSSIVSKAFLKSMAATRAAGATRRLLSELLERAGLKPAQSTDWWGPQGVRLLRRFRS